MSAAFHKNMSRARYAEIKALYGALNADSPEAVSFKVAFNDRRILRTVCSHAPSVPMECAAGINAGRVRNPVIVDHLVLRVPKILGALILSVIIPGGGELGCLPG